MVITFLLSRLMDEGNLRIILQRAGFALNLGGHGLIRLTLTNLQQIWRGVDLSSLQRKRLESGGVLEGVGLVQKLQDANS